MSTTIFSDEYTVYPIIVPTKSSLKSVNFYLIKSANTLTLIDAGYDNDEHWQAFQQVLYENELSISDIDRIILTHHHIDHIGLINRISEKKIIPIYAHPKSIPRLKRDKEFLSMRAEFYEQLFSEMGCGEASKAYIQRVKRLAIDPDGYTVNGEITPIPKKIENFQTLETPGHAVDHVALFDRERNWLFAGDLLLSRTSTNALVEPDEHMQRLSTLVQYRRSLMELSALNVEITFPGHQNLIYNHKELIENRLNRIDKKANKLLHLIQKGLSTASEIAKEFYKEKYKSQFPLVMSEIIGHLDYLEAEEKIYSKLVDGIRHYYVG